MGCFQALEVLKIASGQTCILFFPFPFQLVETSLAIFFLCFHFLPSHCDISVIKCWNRFYCNKVLCLCDKTNRNVVCYLFSIVFWNFWGFFVLSLRIRLTAETRLFLSCSLCCIAIHTPGHDVSLRGTLHCSSPPKLPNVATLWLNKSLTPFHLLSLDRPSQRPAVNSCWCLTLRISDSGPSSCGPNRPAARCVENTPAWSGL